MNRFSKQRIDSFWWGWVGLLAAVVPNAWAQDSPAPAVSFPTEPWPCYTIDGSLCGADGIKLADANGDGLQDLVVGWEESGQVRAYFHPGKKAVREAWPFAEVGTAPSVEDAVWVDLNGDGRWDVLSSCEGNEQSLRMHFAPAAMSRPNPAWRTQVLAQSQGLTRWMFAETIPAPSASKSAADRPVSDLVLGSKDPNGMLAILRLNSTNSDDWQLEKLADASWIMTIEVFDMDGDGDQDVLYSDRKGSASGVYWLENPELSLQPIRPGISAAETTTAWSRHLIGGLGREIMFLGRGKSPGTIYASVKPNHILRFIRKTSATSESTLAWDETSIQVEPKAAMGTAKSIAAGDLDGDGQVELVLSFEGAENPKRGVVYLAADASGNWKAVDVSGPTGIKFDLVRLVDLDLDGDLDILTCEEREGRCGMGVVWYANPHQ